MKVTAVADHMRCMGEGCEAIQWVDMRKLFAHSRKSGHAAIFVPDPETVGVGEAVAA